MTKGKDGGVLIGGPAEFERQVKEPCKGCNGTARDAWAAENNIDQACDDCDDGYWKVWKYDYPSMRFGVMQMAIMRDLLGFDGDGEGWTGWIPPEDVPVYMRRMIALKNGETQQFTQAPTDTQSTFVDKSGDIPEIKRGAHMIGGGASEEQIKQVIDRMMEIFMWAKKHNCGVSWA